MRSSKALKCLLQSLIIFSFPFSMSMALQGNNGNNDLNNENEGNKNSVFWPSYSQNIEGTGTASNASEINLKNVKRYGLRIAYEYHTLCTQALYIAGACRPGESPQEEFDIRALNFSQLQAAVASTPSIIGNKAYFTDKAGFVHAMNIDTGQKIWRRNLTRTGEYNFNTGVDSSVWPFTDPQIQSVLGENKVMTYSRNTPAISGDYLVIGNQMDFIRQRGFCEANSAFIFLQGILSVPTSCTYSGAPVANTIYTVGPIQIPIKQLDLRNNGAVVMAMNRHNGDALWATKIDDNPYSIITSSPVIYKGIVYVGVSSHEELVQGVLQGDAQSGGIPGLSPFQFHGSVAALDLKTGKLLWQTYTVPFDKAADVPVKGDTRINAQYLTPNEFAGHTPGKPVYSSGSVWAGQLTVDVKRGLIYAGVGENNSSHDYDVICEQLRRDNNLTSAQADKCFTDAFLTRNKKNYAGSIIALDMQTGKVVWVQKFTGGAHFKFKPNVRELDGFYDTWNLSCLASKQNEAIGLRLIGSPNNAYRPDIFYHRCPTVRDDGNGYKVIPGNKEGDGIIVWGNDYDFGQSPALITLKHPQTKGPKQLLVAGQKSAILVAMDPDKSGKIAWILDNDELGYGGKLGGFAFGLTSDGERVYVSTSMSRNQTFDIVNITPPFGITGETSITASDSPFFVQVGDTPTVEAFQITNPVPEASDLSRYGDTINSPARIFLGTGVESCYNSTNHKCAAGKLATRGGIWSAVNLSDGSIVWQRPNPMAPFFDNTVMTYANGLLFVSAKGQPPGELSPGFGRLYVLEALTGNVLQQIDTNWVTTRPSVSKSKVLWPLGYWGETLRVPNTGMLVLELDRNKK